MFAFRGEPMDMDGVEDDPADDVLTALRKRDARERVRQDRHGLWTYDEFMRRLYDLRQAGLGEPWAVTSLFRTIEDDLAYYLRDDGPKITTEEALAELAAKRDADHPENRDKYDDLMEMMRGRDARLEEFMARNKALYDEWRRLAGERVDTPTVAGSWPDCAEDDYRNSGPRE